MGNQRQGRRHRICTGVIVIVESRGNPRDSQIERTICCGDVRNRRRKDPVVCSEGIDYRVGNHGEVEKGLGVAVFSRCTVRVRVDVTFRGRVVHIVVDRARGGVVDRGRSTVREGHVVVNRVRGVVRTRSTVRVGRVNVDRARGVVVEESERVLRRGYERGCHCGPRERSGVASSHHCEG